MPTLTRMFRDQSGRPIWETNLGDQSGGPIWGTRPKRNRASHPNRLTRPQLPLPGSNQDSPDPEAEGATTKTTLKYRTSEGDRVSAAVLSLLGLEKCRAKLPPKLPPCGSGTCGSTLKLIDASPLTREKKLSR